MISALFVIIAAISNAIMDITSHHYPRSIFSKYNPKWWNPRISWMNKYVDWENGNRMRNKKPVQITDAWHFFKSLMIVSFVLAIVLFPIAIPICIFDQTWINAVCWVLILGFIWNMTFNLFYQKIFRK